MKRLDDKASSSFDARSQPPYYALVSGFPSMPVGSIGEAFAKSVPEAPTATLLRRGGANDELVAIARFETLEAARHFHARWEGQKYPAAEVDRFDPATAGQDRRLRVRNGAQQLFAACLHGQRAGATLLLGAAVSPNAYADEFGCTPLLAAARIGSAQLVEQLIAARADVNASDAHGLTALAEASARGHAAVVELLLGAGARSATLDKWGRPNIARIPVPEHPGAAWRSDEQRRVAQLLLHAAEPTRARRALACADAQLAAAAAAAAGEMRADAREARAAAQRADAARALDATRRAEVERRRHVDPTVPRADDGGDGCAERSARDEWVAAARAEAAAARAARAPGAAARLDARASSARAAELARAAWAEAMRGVNPEVFAGEHLRTKPADREGQGDAREAAVRAAQHAVRTQRLDALGAARVDSLRAAGRATAAARAQVATELELELAYCNPLTGARERRVEAVNPSHGLVWCERDGWVGRDVPRVNRAAFYQRV